MKDLKMINKNEIFLKLKEINQLISVLKEFILNNNRYNTKKEYNL